MLTVPNLRLQPRSLTLYHLDISTLRLNRNLYLSMSQTELIYDRFSYLACKLKDSEVFETLTAALSSSEQGQGVSGHSWTLCQAWIKCVWSPWMIPHGCLSRKFSFNFDSFIPLTFKTREIHDQFTNFTFQRICQNISVCFTCLLSDVSNPTSNRVGTQTQDVPPLTMYSLCLHTDQPTRNPSCP